ncbi:hypothetical protein Taro_013503 [Colocasia esculenta]|uniref:Uncharacterized protein n=1 Tax=Colocasia esculenta TaxID=4460 RepID=A0A843UMC1_COLES|nr:hypothetical protein [Colocasia esculenta]
MAQLDGKNHSYNTQQPMAKHEPESMTPPHDNTTQELPLSLTVTDVTHPASPCVAPLETLARAP